ncbi:MAG: septum formation initiator family protein [Proteobacteria bacterium]|jgi:cell division protein FtsB|uniref:Cell division protein FtsB n=1 Tax=SAR92 bacterium BACL26 MAG-121220-bin70 TaxID=1655626 RepID=A0A0R2U4M4_9GAMM|nr:MAG: cell division protein FtsB [SAR92 bacterium BACL26 MAG-121220-bin70]MDA0795383.1 septum formation initiator family protein [Pseudomonadota bacterium]MDA1352638.1 septum formation initiator family protein [Pseudomonadota bacterium]|tara:strand:- start:8441 stop:8761 length:321 start_codon:yes stop_codon:yes gene_type:complete
MRWLLIVLLILLLGLQTRLWVGEGSLAHKAELDNQLEDQRRVNIQLRERNAFIAKEVESLKTNLDSIEAKARKDLGMIKGGEVFYLVTDQETVGPRQINTKEVASP